MEDLHYPIQYAILEIKEKGGYLVGYKDIIRGYIVSKCYVVGHVVTYEKSGNYGITHKVVFPFPSVTSYKRVMKKFRMLVVYLKRLLLFLIYILLMKRRRKLQT